MTIITSHELVSSFISSNNEEIAYCYSYTIFYTRLSDLEVKEVIRPQVPLRPPCYDFSLVADLRFDNANIAPPRLKPTSMKRRAVCARSRDVFTAR
jgi:hypothetical protein